MKNRWSTNFRKALVALCAGMFVLSALTLSAQAPLPLPPQSEQPSEQPMEVPQTAPAPQPVQLLNANQLNDLVAPIALYPDPLISQILVASTYPLEVVEAYQWLQRNPGLTGAALTQAAAAQNWDPSVQALVMFPDALKRLNEDVTWTTNLGNAFLAQQADVMGAVQRMRVSAEQNGRLMSTPQQQVVTTTDAGQPVVEILPTNPNVIYVPAYDPAWVWGPSIYYPYPRWFWGPHIGFYWGTGIPIGAYLGFGWGGWGGWGWHPGWGARTVFVNNTFINRYNFNRERLGSFRGTTAWAHDAYHRQGVPYPSQAMSSRFRSAPSARGPVTPVQPQARSFAPTRRQTPSGMAPQARSFAPTARSYAPSTRSYAPSAPSQRAYAPSSPHAFAPSVQSHGNFAPSRSFAAPSHSGGGGGFAPSSHGGGGGGHSGGGRSSSGHGGRR